MAHTATAGFTTALYDLPFGRDRNFGNNWNGVLDAVVGDWRLSNIFLFQSGAFVTPYFSVGDPSAQALAISTADRNIRIK
jgi:hypothetical protein